MKTALIFLVVVAAAYAMPREVIPVVSRQEVRDLLGQYNLDFVSGDDTKVSERGVLVPTPDGKDSVLVKTGTVSYISPEGQLITWSFRADETGFHPVGEHFPK